MAGQVSTPGASTIARAFSLLGAFDDVHRSLSLSELARRADLPVTTAHRICADLVRVGALSRRESGEYVIGRQLWATAMLAPVQTGLRQSAAPFLHDLHAATRAIVHLAVRDHTQVLYLDRVSGVRSAPLVSRVGGRLPLYATGVGKVLLAHAPAAVVAEVLARAVRFTPYTVVEPAALTRQLDRVRRDGSATTVDEMTMGASSVAVPITGPTAAGDGVVAALGLVVDQLGRHRGRHVALLQVAAGGISRALRRTG